MSIKAHGNVNDHREEDLEQSKLLAGFGEERKVRDENCREIQLFKCSQCGKVYKSNGGLKQHITKMHAINELVHNESEFAPLKTSTQKEEKDGLDSPLAQ